MEFPTQKKISILIVDDEQYIVRSLSQQLSGEFYDTQLAFDGEEALSCLQSRQFDLVILDLKLPNVSGFEILKHIKSNIPSTKVIVLTGYSDLKNVERVKQLGADRLIEKPYEFGEVFDAINVLMKT